MGTFSMLLFFSKEICGQTLRPELKAKGRGLKLLATTPTSRLEKNRRKKKQLLWVYIHIQPLSLIIPNPILCLPASSTNCTSDIFGGKAKGFHSLGKTKSQEP